MESPKNCCKRNLYFLYTIIPIRVVYFYSSVAFWIPIPKHNLPIHNQTINPYFDANGMNFLYTACLCFAYRVRNGCADYEYDPQSLHNCLRIFLLTSFNNFTSDNTSTSFSPSCISRWAEYLLRKNLPYQPSIFPNLSPDIQRLHRSPHNVMQRALPSNHFQILNQPESALPPGCKI